MFHDKICERHEVIVIDKQISTSVLSIILQNLSNHQNLWNLLEIGKICMEHGASFNLFPRSWRSKWEIMAVNTPQA